MHTARIEPHEERLLVLIRTIYKVDRGLQKFLVDRLHSFLGKRTGVLASLLAPGAETGIVAGSIDGGRDAFHASPRTELCPECRALRIIGMFRLIFSIQVVEVAEELVEAVNRRQKLIAVAKMVLAELSCHVALRLEQVGEGGILFRQTLLCGRQADFNRPVRNGLWPVMNAARP